MNLVSMVSRWLKGGGALWGISLLFLLGCGDFFSQQPTEIQTKHILQNLSKVNVLPDVDRPYPARYMAEPKIVTEKDGVKLYYFTRNQPAATLAELIKQQFNFFVSTNPATNQLVVKLANHDEVNAILVFLEEVDIPPIQIRVDCLISEIFADVTMDYETTADIQNLFGTDATLQAFLPGASVRSPSRSKVGLKAGITRNNFDFLIDMLVSRGYAKLLMHPTLEVVNGTTARIETNEHVPIQEKILSGGDIVETIVYTDVTDYLEITPQVYADGTIGLKTKAGIASRTIPEGVDQAPIITTRTIDSQENRLHKGQSLVIGGIRKTERVSVIRGVPFLKDIPLLGVLFSSKDFEDRAKEVLFILTPSISSNGQDYFEMLENIEEKHAKPEYQDFLKEIFSEPFGTTLFSPESSESSSSQEVQTQAQQALQEAKKAKAQAQQTLQDAEKTQAHAQQAKEEAEQAQAHAQRDREEAEEAKAQAQQAQQEAEKAKAQAQQEREKAEKAKGTPAPKPSAPAPEPPKEKDESQSQ